MQERTPSGYHLSGFHPHFKREGGFGRRREARFLSSASARPAVLKDIMTTEEAEQKAKEHLASLIELEPYNGNNRGYCTPADAILFAVRMPGERMMLGGSHVVAVSQDGKVRDLGRLGE